jgi:curved DNA-binding protein CbpA
MQTAPGESAKPREGVPQLVEGWESQGLRLTPSEGFLLSRIDGATPWASLRQIAGMPEEQVDACLERWIAQGIVALAPSPVEARGAAPRACDPALDLPADLQREILDFEARLDRPYHELLGVAADADLRSIKRAFFGLSKIYHPDRYFRRRLGSFGPRLERIFKRIALAYEMLSDPAARAELERPSGPPPAPTPAPAAAAAEPAAREGAAAPPASPRARRREALDRLRRHFRIPAEVLAERRFKARQLREAARAAAAQGRWSEAAASIRLAIAFDPWNDGYKDVFAEIQSEFHRSRADDLIEHGGATAAGPEALRLLEEALHYRPSDARLLHRAAELALELGENASGREYAERACELAPEVAAHHTTLGRALRRAGERALAGQAFERAQRLEPGDGRAAEELGRLRRRRAPRAAGGSAR